MTTLRKVSDDERRARLATRHALATPSRVGSPEAVTQAMTVLHATEPATVHLSCWARMTAAASADVDRALYDDRSLVKQLAMRRTLFVFPRDLLPAAWAGPSARVAATERARMAKDIVLTGIATDGDAWLDHGREQVLAVLADAPEGRIAQDIRRAVPAIGVKVAVSPGSSWTASRVVTHLGLTADVVRGNNTAGWNTSRPRWTLMRHWLGARPGPVSSTDGYHEIVRRWLYSFGPGTEDDLVWWLGATKAIVRRALADVGAVPVTLESGAVGWLLPDDLGEVPDPGPWAALLPLLDPSIMGWQGRDFYLGPHRPLLFDRSGNAGTNAWVNGRVVGCWVQDAAGAVTVRLVEPVPPAARRMLDTEAERLTAWLDGFRVRSPYVTPAMKP
jgi:hypothetical protein